MAENSFIKSALSAKQKIKGIEEKNHYISNIFMVAALCLIILFTLLSGANVNIGSTYQGDDEDVTVRQSFFQLAGAAFSSFMTAETAQEYFEKVSKELNSYNVLAPSAGFDMSGSGEEDTNIIDDPFHSLDFTSLLADAKSKMGNKVNSINWIKYKYALSVVIADTNLDAHKSSWDGHVAVMLAGQTIFEMLIRFAIIIISLVMLVFAIIALVKRKKFTKAKFSLTLLMICFFASVIFKFGFITPDALSILTLILIPLSAALYALLSHILLEKRDFSVSMLIYNAVILAGSALVFVFMTCSLFKVTDNYGASQGYGWNFLFDLLLGEGAYMSVPMSYFLQSLIMSVLLMLNVILCSTIMISLINKFMGADYQHNDKKAMLIGTAAHSLIVVILIGVSSAGGSLRITSLDLTAKANIAFLVLQMLTLAGLIAFCYLFKPKAVKKENLFRDAAPVVAAPATPATPAAKPAESESKSTENKGNEKKDNA